MPTPHATERQRQAVSINLNGFTAPYGFTTNHNDTAISKFGHTKLNDKKSAVFGANLPVPPRASWSNTQGTYSSYFDWSKYEDFRSDPTARITKAKYLIPRKTTKFTKLVYVNAKTENGTTFKYAWYMPKWLWGRLGEATGTLKINEIGDDDVDLWMGVNHPKPLKGLAISGDAQGSATWAGHDASFTAVWIKSTQTGTVYEGFDPNEVNK